MTSPFGFRPLPRYQAELVQAITAIRAAIARFKGSFRVCGFCAQFILSKAAVQVSRDICICYRSCIMWITNQDQIGTALIPSSRAAGKCDVGKRLKLRKSLEFTSRKLRKSINTLVHSAIRLELTACPMARRKEPYPEALRRVGLGMFQRRG